MNKTNFFQIFALLAFVALLLISCWATVESLHLLLPTWPIAAFWVLTVIFFVIASLGTKLIVDSLNQATFVENRGLRLIGGIVLSLAFWLCFFLPTNTHTLFYRASIEQELISDLTDTKTKLQSLANGGEAEKIISQEKADFRNNVDAIFSKFAAEINNPGNPGWRDKAEAVIIELEGKLGPIQRLKLGCSSFQCRQQLVQAMREQVDNLLISKLKSTYDTRLANINSVLTKKDINNLIATIGAVQAKIGNNPSIHGEPTQGTTDVLSEAYKTINIYSDNLIKVFTDKKYKYQLKSMTEQKEEQGGDISKTARMRSVFDVWKKFFAGDYEGRGFAYWIVIAALVDIAGFICFHYAFAKKD